MDRQPYTDKPHEERAGYKHRSTDKFMKTFKKAVMDRCQQEDLHQIDLLAPAERKITQAEYMAQKDYLRNAIDECAATSLRAYPIHRTSFSA